jgi:hypothetical protein
VLSGKWTFRSFRNTADLVADDTAAALALIVDEGVFDFEHGDDESFRGALGMANGHAFRLTATVTPGAGEAPALISIRAEGIDGTPTAGWRYDYRAVAGFHWPNGVGQVPSLVGTVVRAASPNADAPAGETASFIAVHQASDPNRRTARRPVRRNALMVGL